MDILILAGGAALGMILILVYTRGEAMFNTWRNSRIRIHELKRDTAELSAKAAEDNRLEAEADERRERLRQQPPDDGPSEPQHVVH